MCVYLCECMPYLCVCALRGQKRALAILKLELQAVMGYPMYFLGTELESSARASNARNS